MDLPQTNLKDYVIRCRQANMPDSKISEALKSSNWPEDIIENVLRDADSVVQPVPEAVEQQDAPSTNPDAEKKQDISVAESKSAEKKPKKQFSTFIFISFLLSPIPFLGMVLCMISHDHAKKRDLSGGFLAILGILINTVSNIVFLMAIINKFFPIFSDPDQLTGFSKYFNDIFNLI